MYIKKHKAENSRNCRFFGKLVVGCFILCLTFIPCRANVQDSVDRATLAADIESWMLEKYLACYFPKILDNEYGGYHCGLDRSFNPSGISDKPLNIMSRHLWASSWGIMLDPENEGYRNAALAGFVWIRDKLWDRERGGLLSGTDRMGVQISHAGQYGIACDKPSYHTGFAILGLSTYFRVTGDTMALHIAKNAYYWMEEHGHDDENGWYYNFLSADGAVLDLNNKDSNVGMHYMEGLCHLYLVWPDLGLKQRIKEMLDLFFDKWFKADGTICLYNNRNYTACALDEKGHNVELVYLLYQTSQIINDDMREDRIAVLKRLHDVSRASPGVPFGAYWWYDAELLASFAHTGILLGGGEQYVKDCQAHWEFIKEFYFDMEFGGWLPNKESTVKGDEWMATYHAFKCMLYTRNLLLGAEKSYELPVTSGNIYGKKQKQAVILEKTTDKRNKLLLYANHKLNDYSSENLFDLHGRKIGSNASLTRRHFPCVLVRQNSLPAK
jgi:mannobiose 2-epimerase